MGTKYSTVAVSGYNATPPSDDGTVSESNKVKWSTIKTKLPDPIKTALDSINSNLVIHFDRGPVALVANTTLGATHYGQMVQVSGSGVTLTLTDAAALTAGWFAEIVSTDAANSVTLARATASDTINETTANITILPLQHLRVAVNAAANGFLVKSGWRHSKATQIGEAITLTDLSGTGSRIVEADANGLLSATSNVSVLQVVNTQTGAFATGTTTIPFDDTIPQNTEGDEYMSLSITPKSTSNILIIEVEAQLLNTAGVALIGALFQDTTANALAACFNWLGPNIGIRLYLRHTMVAGTTSSTTFKLRAGGESAGTTNFNGQGGARKLGGVLASSITITEISP